MTSAVVGAVYVFIFDTGSMDRAVFSTMRAPPQITKPDIFEVPDKYKTSSFTCIFVPIFNLKLLL